MENKTNIDYLNRLFSKRTYLNNMYVMFRNASSAANGLCGGGTSLIIGFKCVETNRFEEFVGEDFSKEWGNSGTISDVCSNICQVLNDMQVKNEEDIRAELKRLGSLSDPEKNEGK